MSVAVGVSMAHARACEADTPDPALLSEVVGAEYAARGCFEARGEGYAFVSEEDLWGDPGALDELLSQDWPRVRADGEGGLEVSTKFASMTIGDYGWRDAGAPGLWFVAPARVGSRRCLIRQPLELEEGFRALHRGEVPTVRFRVLQVLDQDLRWSGLEDMFAEQNSELIDEMHHHASDWQSEVCFPALDALEISGALDLQLLRAKWKGAGEHERFPTWIEGVGPLRDVAAPWDRVRPLPKVELSHWEVDVAEFESAFEHLFESRIPTFQNRYSSSKFSRASAGRCLVAVNPAGAIARIRSRAGRTLSHSSKALWALAHIPHGVAFHMLEDSALEGRIGSQAVGEAIRGLGIQNVPRSLGVIETLLREREYEPHASTLCDALARLENPRALAVLRSEEGTLGRSAPLAYARARLVHGDPWGREAVLVDFRRHIEIVVGISRWGRDTRDSEPYLTGIWPEDPAVTSILRELVEATWPIRWETYFGTYGDPLILPTDLESQAGSGTRSSVLGEIARRDPAWLGDLALEHMASDHVRARIQGANVFWALTGRTHGYSPIRLASERRGPLESLRRWWSEHRTDGRNAWMVSFFRDRGYALDTLEDRTAIPVLVEALGGSPTDHAFAVEQIACLIGMDFGPLPMRWSTSFGLSELGPSSPEEQAHNRARVIAWLEARGWLE